MSRKLEFALIGVWVTVFAMAGAWGYLSSDPFPLPGLRKLAADDVFNRMLQVASVLFAALWLVVESRHKRDHLLVFEGIAVALALQGFLYIGVPFGLAFASFVGIARQHCSQARFAR